ncbi:branched chain amino acid ABC transporter substrate-binding protein [Planctomycetales bacterium]|nr:branched chain amino acid ABC transporter substrate-binding protein [Planctomycetales bacterium]
MSIKRIVIILTILFCGCQQRDTFKVGVELPLSGDAAQYGAAMKNGIDLAYSESPIKSDIQLLYEDDRGDPKTSTSIVTKFVSNNKVDVIIGGAMSSIAASIIPITSKHKTVVISPYATAAELFGDGKYFYSLLPSDDAEGEYMVNYMASVGIDSIGVLYINTDYGTGIAAAFTKGCEGKKLQILFSEGYTKGNTDFKTQLLKMKQLNVKAIYIPGYYAETSMILKQIRELGCNFKIFGSSNFYDTRFLEQSDVSAEGVIFCYPAVGDSTSGAYQKFVDNYQLKYNQKPDAFAIQGYDSFKLIEKIILDNHKTGKIDFDVALKKAKDFQGVNSIIKFSTNGSVRKSLNIYEIKNGKFEVQ